jgi:hypothetical protein
MPRAAAPVRVPLVLVRIPPASFTSFRSGWVAFAGTQHCPTLASHAGKAVGRPELGRSSTLVADFLHLIRAQPGDHRCTRNRIQGIELRMDVLHGQLGHLTFVA